LPEKAVSLAFATLGPGACGAVPPVRYSADAGFLWQDAGGRLVATLADRYEAFLGDAAHLARLRPRTVRAYRYELAAAAADPRFGAPLDALRLADLEAWLARPPAAPRTVGRRAATFARFFAWAIRHGHCARDPLVGRAAVRTRRSLPRPIRDASERDALAAAIAAAPPPNRLIFTILSETGMRAGEALALRWADVALDAGREALRVREPKGGAERVVVLGPAATPRTLRALRAWRNAHKGTQPHEPLFRSNRGTAVSYDALHYQWAKLCAAAGLVDAAGKPRYTPHQLRHTRGSELIAQGQRLEIVQRVLGHRDIRSTLGYVALAEAQIRAALEGGDAR